MPVGAAVDIVILNMDVQEITFSPFAHYGYGTYHADVNLKIYSCERTQRLYRLLYQTVLTSLNKITILQQLL